MKRPYQQQDPDLYLRVVERHKGGIVVRGAKAHNTIAPYADEIIAVPTRQMTKEDADWAVAFAIPADTEGVKLICRATSVRRRNNLTAPVEQYGSVDSFTIFDDVFVPWERVFMCGEYRFAGQLASLFATYHRHSYTGCKPATTDLLMGAAAVVARYHAGVNIYREHEILVELAGGLPATIPLEGDFDNPETGPLLSKYIMRNPAITAENQHRCFRTISDMLCSAHAGVMQVAGVHGGGSPIMEKITIMNQYNLETREKVFKDFAGIED